MKKLAKRFVKVMKSPRSLVMFIMFAVVALNALPALAVTAPAAGSLFYDVYDIVVTQMLQGGIGFVAAVLIFALGIGLFLAQKIIPGIIAVVCAALLIRADAIVTSLGLMM